MSKPIEACSHPSSTRHTTDHSGRNPVGRIYQTQGTPHLELAEALRAFCKDVVAAQ
jgi:hypothetical protein